jgi:hypothetical protein
MVACYVKWHRLEVGAFTLFYGRGNCPGLLSCGVWFSSMTMPARTRQSRLESCWSISIWKCWKFPSMKYGCYTQPLLSVSCLKRALLRTSFHLRWKRPACYHHVDVQRERDCLCPRDGQTYHTLWQVSQTVEGPCWKISYQWHLHSVSTFISLRAWQKDPAKLLLSSDPSSTFNRCKQTRT